MLLAQHTLTDLQPQWRGVIETAEKSAEEDPESHERTLFMISAFFSMYLRISELAASDRWTPTMNDFQKDHSSRWWFTTVGKGNKERQIAVSDTMLTALRRWRRFQGLSALPSPVDKSPLLPSRRGNKPLSNTTHIREIVQLCFDRTIESLAQQDLKEEAEAMMDSTVHWLRHTGISEDVKVRPREHVRDDAGHGSSAVFVNIVERCAEICHFGPASSRRRHRHTGQETSRLPSSQGKEPGTVEWQDKELGASASRSPEPGEKGSSCVLI